LYNDVEIEKEKSIPIQQKIYNPAPIFSLLVFKLVKISRSYENFHLDDKLCKHYSSKSLAPKI